MIINPGLRIEKTEYSGEKKATGLDNINVYLLEALEECGPEDLFYVLAFTAQDCKLRT